jgi:transposase, IS5 family
MKFYAQNYKQLDLGLFKSSLEGLDKSNRWVALGDHLPWVELEKVYNSRLGNLKRGAGNKPARMVLGAMIIKHKLNLSDIETIEIIRENPYMQYLCGLPEYTDKPIFDPSLFVTIRNRISEKELNDMTVCLMEKREREDENSNKSNDGGLPGLETEASDDNAAPFVDTQGREHKGVLKIDATCADAEMRYPVDVDIIHDGCRKVTDYIKKVCDVFGLRKPSTNYKPARQAYIQLIKKSKKRGKMVRDTIALMLNYLYKDIRILLELFSKNRNYYECLFLYEKRTLTAIFKMYHQQKEMFTLKNHTCANRILSIFQPHVRAIVRGKAKAKTEFGAKIGASIVKGYTFIDHHSWNAYNECNDLKLQIELYKKRFGYLPSTILADKIYLNKANRGIIKGYEIQSYCKPLGRPPKDPPSAEMKSKMAKAAGERNEIECSFGTGKRIYRANNIRAKLPDTARCWTGMCYFVKNVMKFLRELCHALTQIWRILVKFDDMETFVRNCHLRVD